jgi:hypothetical protein
MTTDSSREAVSGSDQTPGLATDGMSTRTLLAFFALAFGLCWGVASLLLVFADQLEPIFGPVSGTNPVFVLAVYAPGIAAVALVWRHFGVKGIGSFFKRVTLWRMPIGWWAFLLLGIPAVKYLGAAMNGTLDDPFPFSPWYTLVPALATTLFIGPVSGRNSAGGAWRCHSCSVGSRRSGPASSSAPSGVCGTSRLSCSAALRRAHGQWVPTR